MQKGYSLIDALLCLHENTKTESLSLKTHFLKYDLKQNYILIIIALLIHCHVFVLYVQ